MRKYGLHLLFLGIILVLVPAAAAQDRDGVEIAWPPPVTEIWGSSDIMGTAAVPGMAYYYLEYLPLNPDLSQPDSAPWIPLTIAIEKTVTGGVLAAFDTTQVPDGLYALRLVVNTLDGDRLTDVVTPIRVNNARYQQVREAIMAEALAEPTAQPTVEITAAPEAGKIMIYPAAPITAVNVRRCDLVDNFRCAYVASLTTEGAEVLAVSSNGSGWYQARVPSGVVGWVSPTVTAVTGDTSSLPRVQPPAPLAPQPPTAAPLSVIPNGIAIEGGRATCGQNFNVQINVNNTGNVASQPGSVSLQDVNVRTGEITFSTFGSYPALNPGANYVVVIPMLVAVYPAERHELRAYAGGQTLSMRYTPAQGNCQPTVVPIPPERTITRDFAPGECFVTFPDNTPAYNTPFGLIVAYLSAATKESRRGRVIDNSSAWYRLHYPDLGNVWVRRGGSVRVEGRGCAIRR